MRSCTRPRSPRSGSPGDRPETAGVGRRVRIGVVVRTQSPCCLQTLHLTSADLCCVYRAAQMAAEFPHATVVGLDIIQSVPVCALPPLPSLVICTKLSLSHYTLTSQRCSKQLLVRLQSSTAPFSAQTHLDSSRPQLRSTRRYSWLGSVLRLIRPCALPM